MINIFVSVLIIIFFPFIFLGLINRVKSFWGGRKGPSIIQPLRDFIKLLKKGEVISSTTSFIFRISPAIILASSFAAALLAPLAGKESILSFDGNLILFAYVLATGKFFAIISAMDTGSSFEGMGASREATYSSLVEPAFFIIIGTLVFTSKSATFEELFRITGFNFELRIIIIMLCALAFFIMLITEGCRVPVDDPNTHLELTMIHEVMILDNSGPDLGFLLYAAGLKMVVISSLIVNIILPDLPPIYSIPAFIFLQIIIAAVIGTIESLMARLRMIHIPQLILFMSTVSMVLLAVVVLFVSGGFK